MGNWTPGPWIADVSVNHRGGWEAPSQGVVIGNGNNIVAMYDTNYAEYPDDDTNKANAHLIAAAPDLLNALTVLADAAESMGIPCDAARAAITRATGAQP